MFTVFSDKQAFSGVSFYLVFCSLDQGYLVIFYPTIYLAWIYIFLG